MKEHKYKYVYKITCLVESSRYYNHYYIGQHSTNNLDDGYCGSGVKISRYINKYGNIPDVTYKKEILAFAETQEELNELEYKFIGDLYSSDKMCLNYRAGGNYKGRSEEDILHHSIAAKNFMKRTKEEDPEKWENWHKKVGESNKGKIPWNKGIPQSEDTKKKNSESHKGKPSYWKGKNLNEETKQKISKTLSGRKLPEETKNKMKGRTSNMKGKHHNNTSKKKLSDQITGRIWINNGIEQHQIRPEDISKYPGFVRGMLKKKKKVKIF